MTALIAKWNEWSVLFAAFSLRERAITAITLLVGGCFLIMTYLLEPWQLKATAASNALNAVKAQVPQQEALLRTYQAAAAAPVDPDIANRQRLAQVKEQLAAVSEWLKQFETSMVPPDKVRELLEGVLARNPRLEFLSMKTLAPVAMTATSDPSASKGGKAGGAPGEGVVQHTIELNLAGSYNDLLNYVAALERLPQHLMWTSANIKVDNYPRTTLVLRVYTLSFDNNWLQI